MATGSSFIPLFFPRRSGPRHVRRATANEQFRSRLSREDAACGPNRQRVPVHSRNARYAHLLLEPQRSKLQAHHRVDTWLPLHYEQGVAGIFD